MTERKVIRRLVYQLSFHQRINDPNGDVTILVLEQRRKQGIKLDRTNYDIGLLGVRFNRKIYQPGEIEAEIEIEPGDGVRIPTAQEVRDLLLRRQLELFVVEYDDAGNRTNEAPVCIARNYYVHGITPRMSRQANGLRMTVGLAIYSMDKLMTLDKYSKAYVTKKLGSGILEMESLGFGYEEGQITVDKDHLRHLKYGQQMLVQKLDGTVTVQIPSEFIHPYLVQYNETFYDFMARTANRCGEFFYFEDGKLTLGLPEGKETYELDGFREVTYQDLTTSPMQVEDYARDSMKDGEGEVGDTNYQPVKKNAAGYPNDAFPRKASYHAEVNNDEYLFPLYNGKFTSFEREMGYVESGGDVATQQVFSVLEAAASASDGIGGFAVALGTDTAKSLWDGHSAAKETNESGYEDYIKGYWATEQGDGVKTVLFGTVKPIGWTTLRFFQDVKHYEEEQQKQMICIDMSPCFVALKLGEQIKVKGLDQTFIIVQIEQEAELARKEDRNSSRMEPRMKIYAIPLAEVKYADGSTEQKPFPPVLPVSPIRKSGPQTAFITDNNDPKYQGRVRIVYPWQSADMPERKALEDAEKTLMELQQEYDMLNARYESARTAYFNWRMKTYKEEEKQKAKEGLTNEIELLDKSIKAADSEISLNNELIKILQQEDNLLKGFYDQKRLAAGNSVEAEVGTLKAAYPTIDADIKIIEKKPESSLTEEEKTKLAKLKLTKYIIERLTSASTSLKDLEKSADVYATFREISSEFELKIVNLQQANDKKAEEKVLLEKEKAKLEQEKADLDLTEEEYEKKDEEYRKEIEKEKAKIDEKEEDKIKKALEKAQQDLEDAQKNVESKAKEFNGKICKMATPWIRVAQPMATEGGGTFFKPMVGDEVLVNFEGGNIERPYVVGSLYSKNTLVPDERINRTVGPNLHANASIAIVSPNGHGITFKDPTKGDSFFTSVYPGLGVFNEYADKVGFKIPLPKTKDVTGGIRIGDRYGLYSIDMSSDKRSVSIKSSMGTVKLNAFTGITISAPNGDVKIEGKNVSIKAGNNLSLSSGTNIKNDLSSDTVRGFFLSKVDMALGMATSKPVEMFVQPFLDASLFRTVLEVFLKPIEGTMLIKSKRYLKLEAGSGKTAISKDRYKDWDPNKLQKTATKQQLYKALMDAITNMNDRLNKYKVMYRPLWTDAAQKKEAYTKIAKKYYKDNQLKEYVKKAMDIPTSEEWTDNRKIKLEDIQKMELKKKALWFRKSQAVKNAKGKDEKKKAKEEDKKAAAEEYAKQTEPALNEMMKAIHALHKHYDSFDHIYDDVVNMKAGIELATMKMAFDNARTLGFKPYDLDGIDEDKKPDKTFTTGIRTFKRQVAAIFMMMIATEPEFKENEIIKVAYTPEEMTEKKLKDTYLWNKFLSEMEEKPKHPLWNQLWGNLKDDFKDAADVDAWKTVFSERDVWNDRKGGQILFSDDENSTVNLDGGAMSVEKQAQSYNLGKLKQLLVGLD